jgi:hypothetical protein
MNRLDLPGAVRNCQFSRVYPAYIWFSFCRVFRSALHLSPEFKHR